MTACSMPKHVAVSSALTNEISVLCSKKKFFFCQNWWKAGRGEQFEEVSSCFLSIAGCERLEKSIYTILILTGKYRNPDDSGLPIGPIFKGRIPTFRDKLTFPSSRAKNPDVSGDKLSVPYSGVKNPDASIKAIRPIFKGQECRRFARN